MLVPPIELEGKSWCWCLGIYSFFYCLNIYSPMFATLSTAASNDGTAWRGSLLSDASFKKICILFASLQIHHVAQPHNSPWRSLGSYWGRWSCCSSSWAPCSRFPLCVTPSALLDLRHRTDPAQTGRRTFINEWNNYVIFNILSKGNVLKPFNWWEDIFHCFCNKRWNIQSLLTDGNEWGASCLLLGTMGSLQAVRSRSLPALQDSRVTSCVDVPL